MKIIIKLTIAVMLFACWANLPGKYAYPVIKLFIFMGFVWLVYKEFKDGHMMLPVLALMAAILLNPLYEFPLSAYLQNKLYLALVIGLIIWSVVDFFIILQRK